MPEMSSPMAPEAPQPSLGLVHSQPSRAISQSLCGSPGDRVPPTSSATTAHSQLIVLLLGF